MRTILFLIASFLLATQAKAAGKISYFSCQVREPTVRETLLNVRIRFAVKDLDIFNGKGSLIDYLGTTEIDGPILIEPTEHRNGKPTLMSNLNAQEGDLRIEGDRLRLFGNGYGNRFTDLVIWGVDNEARDRLEGYVHDYGPAYGNADTFKQFIKCHRSSKIL